jgi:hypothetical protein
LKWNGVLVRGDKIEEKKNENKEMKGAKIKCTQHKALRVY